MIRLLKKMFSAGQKTDYRALINAGAVIIDVRTKGEYSGGHVKNSVNIPLNVLLSQVSQYKNNTPIITCCASGMRSATAKNTLKAHGYTEVYDGGSWMNLKKYEK